MKKILLLFAAFAAATVSLQAQDLIVLRNASADEIPAKVLEVGDTHIRYRKFSNIDGPVYSVSRSEVFFIRYENGEKEVISAADAVSNNDTPSIGSSLLAQVKSGSLAQRKPLRDRLWEVGVSLTTGMSLIIFEVDSWTGMNYKADFSTNFYFNRYSSDCVGVSLGYALHGFFPDGTDDTVSLSMMDMDLYFGSFGSGGKSKFGGKVGFSLGFPFSCKMGGYDLSDSLNGVTFGLFTNLGWSWKHSDLGLRIQYSLSNTFKETDSALFGLSLYYGYRF